jgi:hypothetical protein
MVVDMDNLKNSFHKRKSSVHRVFKFKDEQAKNEKDEEYLYSVTFGLIFRMRHLRLNQRVAMNPKFTP